MRTLRTGEAVRLELPDGASPEQTVGSLLEVAGEVLSSLREGCSSGRIAATSRVRGTGPGVSVTRAIAQLESRMPLELMCPFEGSMNVAGAAWRLPDSGNAVAKLVWESDARDLPLHAHEHADRFIIVLRGRGFFHATGACCAHFDGTGVETTAVREGDVVAITRNTLHTFSTTQSRLTLVSCQLPFIPFDDPRQFRLPAVPWTAESLDDDSGQILVHAAWSALACH